MLPGMDWDGLRTSGPQLTAEEVKRRLEDLPFEPPSMEEIQEILNAKPQEKKGLTVAPWVSVQEVKVDGKRKIIPMVGVQGTF